MYYLRDKKIKEAKSYLEKISNPSEFIQVQYYKLMLEDPLLPLPEKIYAEQKIEVFEKKGDSASLIVIDV